MTEGEEKWLYKFCVLCSVVLALVFALALLAYSDGNDSFSFWEMVLTGCGFGIGATLGFYIGKLM